MAIAEPIQQIQTTQPNGTTQTVRPVRPVSSIQTIPYRRVYVWELPVRIFHWVNAASILLLFATGLLIGAPLTLWTSAEPFQQHWFGWVRFIHFATSYVFLFNIVFR